MSKNNSDDMFSAETIEQLTKDFEMAVENDDEKTHILPTRASVKRQFVNLDTKIMFEVQDALEKLDEQLGVTDIVIRHISQDEIDSLVDELLVVRKVNDILSSREETLKTFAKNVIALDQMDPDTTSGNLTSFKHKLKISKEIRGGKLSIDVNLLRKRLTNTQFQSVTDMITTTVSRVTPEGKITQETTITHEVNEKYLEEEMVRGNINSEDVFLSSVESKRTSAIYIRELEE